jgi:hypothetical protein
LSTYLAVAEFVVGLLVVYAMAGLLFAIAFVSVGVRRVDPVATGAGLAFRLIILPGVAALWPLLLRRWIARRGGGAA